MFIHSRTRAPPSPPPPPPQKSKLTSCRRVPPGDTVISRCRSATAWSAFSDATRVKTIGSRFGAAAGTVGHGSAPCAFVSGGGGGGGPRSAVLLNDATVASSCFPPKSCQCSDETDVGLAGEVGPLRSALAVGGDTTQFCDCASFFSMEWESPRGTSPPEWVAVLGASAGEGAASRLSGSTCVGSLATYRRQLPGNSDWRIFRADSARVLVGAQKMRPPIPPLCPRC